MPSVDEITRLKKSVASLRTQRDELQGKIKQLKEDRGDYDEESLKKELIELEAERVRLYSEYRELVEKFKKAHHDRFGDWPIGLEDQDRQAKD